MSRHGPAAGDAWDAPLRRLAASWSRFWPDIDAAALAADADARLADAIRAWGLRDVRPLTGGEIALVGAATRDRRPVVVKVSPRGHADDAELAAEGDVLDFWRPTGVVVEVLDRGDDGFTLLLEHVRPGGSLQDAGLPFEDALVVLGRLARRLHAAGTPPDGRFLTADDHARSWRRAFAGEPALLAELDALVTPGDDDVLVHADLHGGNALRADDGWKVIDPHGLRADRHADVWALLDPLVPPLPAEPVAARRVAWDRVVRYADAAGLDPDRAAAWTRLRARGEALGLEASDAPPADDAAWATGLHRIADALEW